MSFSGKVIVVSGGASGIGKATTKLLARADANVVVLDLDADAAARVAKSEGPNVSFEVADLRSIPAIEEAIHRTRDQFGRIDGLANVAGIYPFVPFLETTPESWQDIDDVNLRGSFFLALHVAKTMIADGNPGAIVNVASGAAYRPIPGMAAYTATKGGIVAMTRSLAKELAPHCIRVNVVSPGNTASDTVRRYMSDEELEKAAANLLPGRWMEPVEVAKAIVFFLGDSSRAMTGAALNVNIGDYMPH